MTTLISRYTAAAVRECKGALTASTLRRFSISSDLLSGHSRWSKIKHDKGKEDSGKSKQRTFLARELFQASKENGPDPNTNPRLALCITNAKKSGFPKASIESAIARAQGLSANGAPLESMTIEAMVPPAVAAVIECQTDSKGRTLQEIRDILKYFSANATPTAFMFDRKGKIEFAKMGDIDDERILEHAIEAGALDVEFDENRESVAIYTEPSEVTTVTESLKAALQLKVESSDITWVPKEDTKVTIESPDVAARIGSFVERLEENPSVQGVYLNAS